MIENCWAASRCKAFNEERSNCTKHCAGYIQLRALYRQSNMPLKYQEDIPLYPKEDKEAFYFLRDWKNDVVANVKAGKGIIIISETKGNGKTTWACKIMSEYFMKVALKNNLRCRGIYVKVAEFLDKYRESYKLKDDDLEDFHEYLDNIYKADLVIWDDLGAEKLTEFAIDKLTRFIDYRYSNNKSQIFTSNKLLEELADSESAGERIVSRIVGQCELVVFVNPDLRGVYK